MKFRMLVCFFAAAVTWSSVADPVVSTFNFTTAFPNSGVIPDGNVAGWSDTRTISGIGGTNIDVNVFLHLSGGYNGDLYGYLVHDSGFAVLLNRVGRTGSSPFGYSDGGMDITFDDAAANGDIHLYQLVPGYMTPLNNGSSWAPDGRNLDPAGVVDTDPRTSLLDDFNGLSPDGTWTLFLADLSVGAETTVVSWGLEITTVPEPSGWALLALGLLGVVGVMRYRGRVN